MKRLFLLRHARARLRAPSESDIERPLEQRGLREACALAESMARRCQTVDFILSSPAERAFATAKLFALSLASGRDRLSVDRRIYLAGSSGLLQLIRELDDRCESALLVGHNPGLSELLHRLCGSTDAPDDLPVCCIAELELDIPGWSQAEFGEARLRRVDCPPGKGSQEPASKPASPSSTSMPGNSVSDLWSSGG